MTCAESLEVSRRAKEAGLKVTASASINHIALNENDIGALPHLPQTVAAIARRRGPQGAGRCVGAGLIDVVMSDHNPQDVETKRLPFAEAAPGAIGIETMLTAGLRLVHNGELELITLLRAMSTRPAELLGLPGGRLGSGAPADVIVVDHRTCPGSRRDELKSKCKNTPFDEARMTGPRGAHHRRRPHGLRIRMNLSAIRTASRVGYLLGSIPFGLAPDPTRRRGDIRSIGSGNIGATNVLRTGRKGLAAATLALRHIQGHRRGAGRWRIFSGRRRACRGLGAFLGHLFPVWLKFKGGKGVAVYIGVLFGLAWPGALVFIAVWLAVAWG